MEGWIHGRKECRNVTVLDAFIDNANQQRGETKLAVDDMHLPQHFSSLKLTFYVATQEKGPEGIKYKIPS